MNPLEALEETKRFGYYIIRKDRIGLLERGTDRYKVTIVDFSGEYTLLKIQGGSVKCGYIADAIATMDGFVVKHRADCTTMNTYVDSLYGFILP